MTDEYVLPAPGETVEVSLEIRVPGGIATTVIGHFPVHVEEVRPAGPQDVDDARAMLTIRRRDILNGLVSVADQMLGPRDEDQQ